MMVLRLTSKLEKLSTFWKIISPCACEDTEDLNLLNPSSLKRTMADSSQTHAKNAGLVTLES